jgi:hypothetical protein
MALELQWPTLRGFGPAARRWAPQPYFVQHGHTVVMKPNDSIFFLACRIELGGSEIHVVSLPSVISAIPDQLMHEYSQLFCLGSAE